MTRPPMPGGRERRAVQRGVELLQQARRAGIRSREAVEALHYVRSLWSILIEDLAQPENDLPRDPARGSDLDRHLGAARDRADTARALG